ncbi:probable peptidoglycan muropeptide transporter SLC46 [Choristoneura fumiferana]|uniref:probable peptidoglycan muropeptide transporter SLC46 n=1 Tax=Choristoneura fumiferana TaxID=7141 RepID=UPI003D155268
MHDSDSNYTKEDCNGFLLPDKTNATHMLEEDVQKHVTQILMVITIIRTIVPVILSLFVGEWSDHHGRKPLIMWPLFGLTVGSLLTTVYSMLDGIGPWWYLAASLPYNLFGGMPMIETGIYCYISDVVRTEKRSLRMTLLNAIIAGGHIVGSLASSPLVKSVGYVYLLCMVTLVCFMALVYTVVYVKESLPGATKGGLRSLFVVRHVKNMVIDFLKRRPNNVRGQVIILTVVYTLLQCNDLGLYNLEYLYTRQKLKWAMTDYTSYFSTDIIISFVGAIAGVVCLQTYLHISDGIIIIMAVASSTVGYLVIALAERSWHMYFGSALSLLEGLANPLIMSFLSKILPNEDTAKIFGTIGVLNAFSPVVAPPMFSFLYNATLVTYSGAIYLLSVSITGACVVMLGFVQYLHYTAPTSTSHQMNVRRNSLDT